MQAVSLSSCGLCCFAVQQSGDRYSWVSIPAFACAACTQCAHSATIWPMLMYKDLPGLQVVVHSIPSFPLLRSLSTLCYFPMVWHGLPPHPMKPKRAEFGQLQLGPKFCQAQVSSLPNSASSPCRVAACTAWPFSPPHLPTCNGKVCDSALRCQAVCAPTAVGQVKVFFQLLSNASQSVSSQAPNIALGMSSSKFSKSSIGSGDILSYGPVCPIPKISPQSNCEIGQTCCAIGH